jgi:PKD domain
MRLRLILCLLLIALPAAPARAAFFPGDSIDGPSADIVSVGEVDFARDGAGAVAYVKRDGGIEHVFVARLVGGAWQPPERIDPGLDSAASKPVLGVADGGRVVAAFISGGALYGTSRVPGATGWSAPVQIAAAASDPALDVSINGVSYVTFTAAGDVLASRLARDATDWAPMAQPLDIDPADASGRSDVAVSADGVALSTFVEGSEVVARKLFGTKVSQVPQVLNVDQVEGQAGGAADSPDVDAEDDSSFAWVVFRQSFPDHPRVLARRLLGSTFDPPVVVDAEASGSTPRIDLSERGEGTTAVATPDDGVVADMLHLDAFGTATRLDTPPSVVAPAPAPTIAENGSATVSWLQAPTPADATVVHGRHWVIDQTRRGFPVPEPDTLLSNPAFGPVDPAAGIDAAADRLGDAVTVFVQGAADQRRLVAAEFDRPPGKFLVYSGSGYRSLKAKPLKWAVASELWGPLTYTVMIDNKAVGTTPAPPFTPPIRIKDGTHHWWVLATDQRGQTARTKSALLRVDNTPPSLHVRIQKTGATLVVFSLAHDKRSGLRSIVTSFGDGTSKAGARVTHRYRHSGTYKVVVRATDFAGARRLAAHMVHVKK